MVVIRQDSVPDVIANKCRSFIDIHVRYRTISDNLHEQKYKFLLTTILTVSDIEKILSESSDTAVQEIDSRLLELQKKLLKKANAK